ncbi:MAG: class I SAM-dependent methyltransferase [Nocardioidaceae bacterium]|nr:class I SAM-dependent methyltransferase [Nocardioidaceae bacterium]
MLDLDDLSPIEAMDAAFAGHPAELVHHDGGSIPLAVHEWVQDATKIDHELFIDACSGTTLDLGCGPGRLTAGLAAQRIHAVGVDISAEAVRQTRVRGAAALQRDVYASMFGMGMWDHALLADGNIGIGGDPVKLLTHARRLVRPGGSILVELGPTGTGLTRHDVRLRIGERMSGHFRWAYVGVDALPELTAATRLVTRDVICSGGRTVAVLERPATAR